MIAQQPFSKFSQLIRWYSNAITLYDIHSPAAYKLAEAMEASKIGKRDGREILRFRNRLRKDRHLFKQKTDDEGAFSNNNRKMSTVGRFSRKSQAPLFAYRRLYRLTRYLKAENILELGTGSGLGHYVLRKAAPEALITSVDADPYLTELARSNIGRDEKRSSFICDSFSRFWQDEAARSMPWDLIILDGDHRGVALLNNFHQIKHNRDTYGYSPTIFIGDIRWSSGMLNAWEEIANAYRGIALDYFHFGILHPGSESGQHLKASIIPYRYKFWRAGFFPPEK